MENAQSSQGWENLKAVRLLRDYAAASIQVKDGENEDTAKLLADVLKFTYEDALDELKSFIQTELDNARAEEGRSIQMQYLGNNEKGEFHFRIFTENFGREFWITKELLDLAKPVAMVSEQSIRAQQRKDGCWEWPGKKRKGYSRLSLNGVGYQAHRKMFETFMGEVPTGMTLDHLCRNRACVNPFHLEVVTNKENVLRGNGVTASNARKKTCVRGHPFNKTNTGHKGAGRYCRECQKQRNIRIWHYRKGLKKADSIESPNQQEV